MSVALYVHPADNSENHELRDRAQITVNFGCLHNGSGSEQDRGPEPARVTAMVLPQGSTALHSRRRSSGSG